MKHNVQSPIHREKLTDYIGRRQSIQHKLGFPTKVGVLEDAKSCQSVIRVVTFTVFRHYRKVRKERWRFQKGQKPTNFRMENRSRRNWEGVRGIGKGELGEGAWRLRRRAWREGPRTPSEGDGGFRARARIPPGLGFMFVGLWVCGLSFFGIIWRSVDAKM